MFENSIRIFRLETTDLLANFKLVMSQSNGQRLLENLLEKEVQRFDRNTYTSIEVVVDEKDSSVVHALIIGPEGTPYENGFFYFVLRSAVDCSCARKACLLLSERNTWALSTWGHFKWTLLFVIVTELDQVGCILITAPYSHSHHRLFNSRQPVATQTILLNSTHISIAMALSC